MSLWQYIMAPTPSLGLWAWLVVIVSALAAIWGIALPKWLFRRQSALGQGGAGVREYGLRAELWIKVGVGIAVWCAALILSLLLRLVGTYGLSTRLLMALVTLMLPFLVGYTVMYCLLLYPRYLEGCRRIDIHKSYEIVAKKSSGKKRQAKASQKPRVDLIPGKAIIPMFVVPVTYYMVMVFVSIPPYLPARNHDHLLHEVGMLVMGLVGYVMGLVLSLGDDLRPLLPWLRMQQEKGEPGVH